MKKLLLPILIFWATVSVAQLEHGQNPNDLDWRVLSSPNVNIIFPPGLEDAAQRSANMINYIGNNHTVSIGPKRKFLNLVMQNETTVSNGYVALAPFRSEFYTTPPPSIGFLGSVDWMDLLTVHEYRHALQFSNTHYGFTKFLSLIQGQSGWSLSQGLTVPNWFLEGDAVWIETNYTEAGRGRTPFFTNFQSAILGNDVDWSYSKWRNGSFRNLVPDHYRLGYTMLSYLRNEQGANVMVPVLKRSCARGPFFWSFSRILKKETGYTTQQLYEASFNQTGEEWRKIRDTLKFTSSNALTATNLKTPTFYHFPQPNSDGNLVALKSSYKITDQIVEITADGDEKILSNPGFNYFTNFHTKNGKYIWTEYRQDPRRNNRNYSDIIYLDSKNGSKVSLTVNGKYFSPVFNSDATSVYAYYRSTNQIGSIKKIDVESKKVEHIIEFDPSEFAGRISLTNDDQFLCYIVKKDSKLSIWKLNLQTKEKTQLTKWTSHVIDALRVSGDFVYYTASYSGIDNIYRTPLDGSMEVEQLTSVPFGAYDPSVSEDGNTLYFTEVIYEGFKISSMQISPVFNGTSNDFPEPSQMVFQDKTESLVSNGNLLSAVPKEKYEITAYNNTPLRSSKLHSWSINPSQTEPSLQISIDNFTRDFTTTLSGGYNVNEQGEFFAGEVSFYQLFPVFTIKAERSGRQADYLDLTNQLVNQKFDETSFGLGIHIPLNWVIGNYNASFTPSMQGNYHIVDNIVIENGPKIGGAEYTTASTQLTASFMRRTAKQNLYSRFGVDNITNFVTSLNSNDIGKFNSVSTLYLPGLWKNHSLRFTGAYQMELLANTFQLKDDFFYPRGFQTPINDDFFKFSTDYSFPLFYPDWGFGGMAYFKRISSNLFFDYGSGTLNAANATIIYRSAGIEFLFDTQLLNSIPISFGLRGSYLLTSDPLDTEAEFVPGLFFSTQF